MWINFVVGIKKKKKNSEFFISTYKKNKELIYGIIFIFIRQLICLHATLILMLKIASKTELEGAVNY